MISSSSIQWIATPSVMTQLTPVMESEEGHHISLPCFCGVFAFGTRRRLAEFNNTAMIW